MIQKRWAATIAILGAAALLGVLPPDGAPRAGAYVLVHTLAVVGLAVGLRRDDLPDRRPWRLLAVGFVFLCISDVAWGFTVTTAPVWSDELMSAGSLLASACFAFAGVLLIGGKPSRRLLLRATDLSILIVATAVLAWQWWVLSSSANPVDQEAITSPFVILMLAASAAMAVVATTLVLSRDPSLEVVVILAVAATLTMSGQGISLLLASPRDPPRFVDAMWFVASALAVIALQHPSAGVSFRTHRASDRIVTPMKLIGLAAAVVVNPILIWQLVDDRENPVVVAAVAATISAVTLAGIWRVARLVSERDGIQDALELSDRRFRSLAAHASDLTLVADSGRVVTYAGPSSAAFLGREPAELEGRPITDLAVDDDRLVLAGLIDAVAVAPAASDAAIEVRFLDATYSRLDVELVAVNLLDDPAVRGIVVTAHDVTQLRSFEARLVHQALHDELTGLANRHHFAERVQTAVDETVEALANGSPDAKTSGVLFIDLDDFKTINDSLGHHAGDRLLRTIGRRLAQLTGARGLAARLGGDEFAILLDDASDRGVVEQFVSELLAVIARPINLGEKVISVTASVGIALSQNDSADVIMRNADTAMFIAKAEGKQTFRMFERQMQIATRKRFDLKLDLVASIAESQLTVHYQPIVSLADLRVVGLEALVRWPHPTLGLLTPDEFVPLAEEGSLIDEIGLIVLEQACRDALAFQARSDEPTGPYVSVNLSPTQLTSPKLLESIRRILGGTQLNPGQLIAEITEQVFLAEDPIVTQNLAELRRIGIGIALDDFGTGYSSLSYLHRLDVDIVKLDKSFARSLATSGRNRTLVRGIVDLTSSLGITTIAEGVERSDQLDDLCALGCEYGQGYHLGRPTDASSVLDRLGPRALVVDDIAIVL